MEEADLAAYEPRWTEPLAGGYRGRTVYELPAPTQGVVALEALALLERGEPTLREQVRCAALALEDGREAVRDGADVRWLLDRAHIDARASAVPAPVHEPGGSTVYVAAVDGDGRCVSLIQSIFGAFGSRVVAGDTGVLLQNRGAGFAVEGAVAPGRRPFHTIIPALLADGDRVLGPFGVVGGSIQAQGHVQLVSALVDDGLDPQAALERPRFRAYGGRRLDVEPGLAGEVEGLRSRGHDVRVADAPHGFGVGQMIVAHGELRWWAGPTVAPTGTPRGCDRAGAPRARAQPRPARAPAPARARAASSRARSSGSAASRRSTRRRCTSGCGRASRASSATR